MNAYKHSIFNGDNVFNRIKFIVPILLENKKHTKVKVFLRLFSLIITVVSFIALPIILTLAVVGCLLLSIVLFLNIKAKLMIKDDEYKIAYKVFLIKTSNDDKYNSINKNIKINK